MTGSGSLIYGDHVSCSRVGGAMRRESSRLHQHALSLADALAALATLDAPGARAPGVPSELQASATSATIAAAVRALRATADNLDEAGAALQRYATDLAEGHELGRRAERRVEAAGLVLEGTRVTEPWGPAGAQEAERRRALVPDVQSRVDLATALVGRARGRLQREMTRLAEGFSTPSGDRHPTGQPAPGSRRSGPGPR